MPARTRRDGDYYDFIPLESGRIGLLLADVCGKGMPAALLGASLHSAIRAYAPAAGGNCGEVLAKANRLLFETTSPDKYATVFYGVYDPHTFTLTYSNAGHYPPLVAAGGCCTRLDSLTPPVGMLPELPARQHTIQLAPGTRLVIASDGVPDAWSAGDEEFGDQRLVDLVNRWDQAHAAEFCGGVLQAVAAFIQDRAQADDVTLIAARSSRESVSGTETKS
jgi:sigma-B regulation protein RsbU (phosphoserine phosphatase)